MRQNKNQISSAMIGLEGMNDELRMLLISTLQADE